MRRLADLVVRWPWAVIGIWIAIAVALPLTFPSLNEMTQRHPLAILPSDAPSSVAAHVNRRSCGGPSTSSTE